MLIRQNLQHNNKINYRYRKQGKTTNNMHTVQCCGPGTLEAGPTKFVHITEPTNIFLVARHVAAPATATKLKNFFFKTFNNFKLITLLIGEVQI